MKRSFALAFVLILLVAALFGATPSVTRRLPVRLSDDAYWKLISNFSEPEGSFGRTDNFVSNENFSPTVFSDIKGAIRPGDVYLGVGPEQNFTYIAAIHPGIAFIVDIRRQNLIEHLIYKALFEASSDRGEFLSRLFSRTLPNGIRADSSVQNLFQALDSSKSDEALFQRNLKMIQDRLVQRHRFKLTPADVQNIEFVYRAFFTNGPGISYWTDATGVRSHVGVFSSYESIMTQPDIFNYLMTAETFRSVKSLEEKNLIVPVVGDFAGPTAILSIGKFARDHSLAITAIYASNVEQYLFAPGAAWRKYYASLSSLPLRPGNLFIRSVGVTDSGVGTTGSNIRLVLMVQGIGDLVNAFTDNKVADYQGMIGMSHCAQAQISRRKLLTIPPFRRLRAYRLGKSLKSLLSTHRRLRI